MGMKRQMLRMLLLGQVIVVAAVLGPVVIVTLADLADGQLFLLCVLAVLIWAWSQPKRKAKYRTGP